MPGDFFREGEGKVFKIDSSESNIAAFIEVEGLDYDQVGAIVTQYKFTFGSNHQFATALDRNVYLFNFGDMMGTCDLSGLVIPESCDGGSPGIGAILDYYDQNKVSADASKPPVVTITLAGTRQFRGYLTNLAVGLSNSKLMMATFNMTIRTLSS